MLKRLYLFLKPLSTLIFACFNFNNLKPLTPNGIIFILSL
ncbi:hypothetical protein ELI_2741 [Eubacterium callanderi]|uniref:Uncharacterized protein n=1 Tax=Eubacterium callanderi TaxID=53442 RepID=E3GEB2_9FIRM|nr:hypothetical protein ELI_2741 [Eubacterium callanderi]